MCAVYAKRTMSLYLVTFNKARSSEGPIDPKVICGKDPSALFEEFCSASRTMTQVNDSERFIYFTSCHSLDGGMIAKYMSGRAGLNVSVVDTNTRKDSGISYGEDQAGMVESRIFFRFVYGFNYAIACVESVPNGGGVTVPLTMFCRYVSKEKMGVTARFEHIQEQRALDAFTGIEQIEVRRYKKPDDVADDLVAGVGHFSHIIAHKQRRLLPKALFNGFLHDRNAIAEYMGVRTDYDGREDVIVTLRQKTGGSRKFVMGKDMAVPVNELLNDSQERPLTDEEFALKCMASCKDAESVFDRM